MYKSKRGFTILELVLVILVLSVLVTVLAPMAIKTTERILIKSRAAVDAAALRNAVMEINTELISDKGMSEITKEMAPVNSKAFPGAVLWVNYTKPISLDVYFVEGDHFYSLDYMSELALHGESDASVKKPLTLGFWYELGIGKVNEYAPRD